jgi:phage terminase large subunit
MAARTTVIDREIPTAFQGLYRPARYKAVHGGRGSAKSHSIADYLVTEGRKRRMRFLCAREIQKSLSTSVHQLLQDKIVEHKAQGEYQVTRDGIRGPHGTHFLFAGLKSNPDSVKSMEDLDGAWVEEADRCSQSSLDLLTPTIRKPGSEIIFSWNRRSREDPVDKLFLGGTPPPDAWVQQVNWRDNPFFPKVLWDEMMWMKGRDRDKWLHVWEGHPLQRSEAKVFSNWRVDDLDDQVPEGARLLYGADWGFANDPTVLIGGYVIGRTLYIRHEAWRVKCAIDDTPALFAGTDDRDPPQWTNRWGFTGLPHARRTRITADSARPETIAYMKARGFDIIPAKKGPGSIMDGVEFMQSYDIVVHPSCTHVEDEMNLYEWKVDKHTDEVLNELADKDNHTIDSVRYMLETIRRSRGSRPPVGAAAGGGFGPRLIQG